MSDIEIDYVLAHGAAHRKLQVKNDMTGLEIIAIANRQHNRETICGWSHGREDAPMPTNVPLSEIHSDKSEYWFRSELDLEIVIDHPSLAKAYTGKVQIRYSTTLMRLLRSMNSDMAILSVGQGKIGDDVIKPDELILAAVGAHLNDKPIKLVLTPP